MDVNLMVVDVDTDGQKVIDGAYRGKVIVSTNLILTAGGKLISYLESRLIQVKDNYADKVYIDTNVYKYSDKDLNGNPLVLLNLTYVLEYLEADYNASKKFYRDDTGHPGYKLAIDMLKSVSTTLGDKKVFPEIHVIGYGY